MRRGKIIFSMLCLTLLIVNSEEGAAMPNERPLFPVRKNNKTGYIDAQGKIVIQPQFMSAGQFSEGLAAVRMLTKEESTSDHADSLIDYKDRTPPGKNGYINEMGVLAIPPQFEGAGDFHEGRAWIWQAGLMGFIDKSGAIVVEPRYYSVRNFSEGLAAVRDERQQWGYVDVNGKLIVEPQFGEAGDFRQGTARVWQNGKYIFINRQGKRIFDASYYAVGKMSEGLAWVQVQEFGRYGYIDIKGDTVIEPRFFKAGDFSEGLAFAAIDNRGKNGYINPKGELVIHLDCDFAENFSDGLAVIGKGNKRGYIDKTGKVVIKPQYGHALGFQEGMAIVAFSWGGPYGYINKKGEMIIKPQFDSRTQNFSGELAAVYSGNKMGYVNKEGRFIWPLQE